MPQTSAGASEHHTPSIFTVDVEDYYHVCGDRGAPPRQAWDDISGRVEANLLRLLDLLDKHQVKATLFFLGYIVERYPQLVREAHSRGHEIASHGMEHRLIYEMTQSEFYEDALTSRKLLEDLTGEKVQCFRSPSFSVTSATPWFFDTLAEAGYVSDSSVFPVLRENGGFLTDRLTPHRIGTGGHSIVEFPISVASLLGKRLCFFGGGYLRLFPRALILRMQTQLLRQGIPTLYYIHPRELDPDHPRLQMKASLHFKTYVNLRTVIPKLEAILGSNSFQSCSQYLQNHQELL